MTAAQHERAAMLDRELRDIASRERAQYKQQVMAQAAHLLRELMQGDDDEQPTQDEG